MTTAPTPEEVHALAARLEHCVAKWGKQNALSLEVYSAVKMMRRLQAEIDRLLAQVHKLEMDALDLASENSILKRTETDELEARKPLPLSDEQLRAEFIPWAEIQYRHEDEFTKRDFKICLTAWSAGRRAALVDKSPNLQEPLVDKTANLQEPLVDKTANLQDRPAALSDDDRLRLRSDVARAIWDVMREHEDRCDHALEDVDHKHQVWDCADAAIETALGIIPRPNPLIARREVVAGGPVRVTRLHLTEEGRAALTSKATGPLPPARVDELMAEAGYLGASAESRADFINGLRHGEGAHGITGGPS